VRCAKLGGKLVEGATLPLLHLFQASSDTGDHRGIVVYHMALISQHSQCIAQEIVLRWIGTGRHLLAYEFCNIRRELIGHTCRIPPARWIV